MRLTRLAYLAPFLLAAACGQKLEPLQPGDGGIPTDDANMSADDGGSSGDMVGAVAMVDMAGFNMAGSPLVNITAPAAGAEVHGDTLTVTATITSPTSTLIAGGSVIITVTPPGGSIVTKPMTLTATANVYQGDIDVSGVPSGMSTFTVSAAD